MLENMVHLILSDAYVELRITYYHIVVIAGLWMATNKLDAKLLSRRPYFLYYALILIASIAPPIVWMGIIPKYEGGYINMRADTYGPLSHLGCYGLSPFSSTASLASVW